MSLFCSCKTETKTVYKERYISATMRRVCVFRVTREDQVNFIGLRTSARSINTPRETQMFVETILYPYKDTRGKSMF